MINLAAYFPGPRAMAADVSINLTSTKGGECKLAIVLPNRTGNG